MTVGGGKGLRVEPAMTAGGGRGLRVGARNDGRRIILRGKPLEYEVLIYNRRYML